jgi:5-methylcytosine-specific restriction endonuclease McrA
MARKAGQGSKWIRPEKRLAIYLRDDMCCAYCGTNLKNAKPEEIGLDHLVCSSEGGSNEPSNLVTACRKCNSSRGVQPWREFATGGAVARIKNIVRRKLNVELAKAIIAGETGDATT